MKMFLFKIFLICLNGHAFARDLFPITYCNNKNSSVFKNKDCEDTIQIYADRIQSRQSVFAYSFERLDFCQADIGARHPIQKGFGDMLMGERISETGFKLKAFSQETCKVACIKNYDSSKDSQVALENLIEAINLEYDRNLYVDNIPVQYCYETIYNSNTYTEEYCTVNIPTGCYVTESGTALGFCVIFQYGNLEPDSYYLFNHLDLVIEYNNEKFQQNSDLQGQIVRVKAKPKSYGRPGCMGNMKINVNMTGNKTLTIPYTYSVKYKVNNNIKWSSRWDLILDVGNQDIHLFSMLNSMIIVLFMTMIMIRIIAIVFYPNSCMACKTWVKNNCRFRKNETPDMFGWKAINEDVFRPPIGLMVLAIIVGNGVHILVTALITLIVACTGYLSPSSQGNLIECIFYTWIGTSVIHGYATVFFYKLFGEKRLRQIIFIVAFSSILCPVAIFSTFLILNGVHQIHGSSTAIPVSTALIIMARLLAVSIPVTMVGSVVAHLYKVPKYQSYSMEPRIIPKKKFYTRTPVSAICGGLLSFGVIVIELFFIYNTIWNVNGFYKCYIFLLPVTLIMIVIISLTSMVMCFFHLNAEDYRWCWRSFLSSSSVVIYMYIYSIYFYIIKLKMTGVINFLVYLGYITMATFLVALCSGSIGIVSCYILVKKIYSNLEDNSEAYTVTVDDSNSHSVEKQLEEAIEDESSLEKQYTEHLIEHDDKTNLI